MQMRENKCHLRLVNCLSRSLQQPRWDVSPGCVKSMVTSSWVEVTGAACTWPTVPLRFPKPAGTMWGLLWLVLVLVLVDRIRQPQTQFGFPASCLRARAHVCNLVPRLWFAAFKRTFVSEGNMNGAFCRVKRLYKPLISPLWCTHLWKGVMCAAVACTCLCACALYQANECGANGTEVIMWSVIALWFLPHLWAASCHF